jgi:hypothetical protein
MKRLAVVMLLALVAGGCGLGAGKKTASDGELTVTQDFGASTLGTHRIGAVKDSDTVMRVLQGDFDVGTRYGGNFVQEIDGVAGGREGGRRVDWFYYVNGIEAAVGAAERKVSPGDRIWWDHHDWTGAQRIPAVVGSYPEPFLDGSEGRKLPVRIVCLSGAGRACDEVEQRLGDAGVTDSGRSVLQQSAGREVLRLLIGPWSEVRKDTAARKLESGPQASGVFARPDRGGRRIELLDPRGRSAGVLGHGGGLVAATSIEGQQPTWVVTGTDSTGVAAAAAALDEDELRDHFAIAIDEGRTLGLPVESEEDGP